MDNRKKWDGGTVRKKNGAGVHQITVAGKAGGFGWNEAGVELYKTPTGYFWHA